MDSAIISAIIGASATVIGAVIGRSEYFDKFLHSSNFPRLTGNWESLWIDDGQTYREIFVITKQRSSRIYGYITMEKEPDKRWNLEGIFNGRFLQLFWKPSKDADNKFFLDYGCYFFELQGDGSFNGFAVGFAWETNKILTYTHTLKRIK